MSELRADVVAARLERLRAEYRPMELAEALGRMRPPRPVSHRLDAANVAARLDELRALCELTAYLHLQTPRDGRAHGSSR